MSMLNKYHSDETKIKIGNKSRGRKQSEERIAKKMIKNSGLFQKGHKINLGKIYSKERINKALYSRLSKSGFKPTRERIEKQRQSLKEYYKEHPEVIEKIRQTNKEYIINHLEEKARLKTLRDNNILPVKDTRIEVKVQNFLKELRIEYLTHQYIKDIEHGYQCDIFIPSMNLVIECDGDYWHSYPTGRDIDHIRTKELIDKGFRVLRLWEFEIKAMNINEFQNKIGELI